MSSAYHGVFASPDRRRRERSHDRIARVTSQRRCDGKSDDDRRDALCTRWTTRGERACEKRVKRFRGSATEYGTRSGPSSAQLLRHGATWRDDLNSRDNIPSVARHPHRPDCHADCRASNRTVNEGTGVPHARRLRPHAGHAEQPGRRLDPAQVAARLPDRKAIGP
jgi:hypothetical protein